MSEWFLEAANHTCGNFPEDVSEFDQAGLTAVECVKVAPPRVAEAAVALECVVRSIIPIPNETGTVTATIVVGTVVLIHVNQGVYDPHSQTIIPERLRPMARLGGNTYSCLGDIFDIARPKVPTPFVTLRQSPAS